MIFDGQWESIDIKDVCSIYYSLSEPPNNGLVILTTIGLCYNIQKTGIKEITEPKNIIQMCWKFKLTDKGEVYFDSTKIEQLPRIVQITDPGIVLTFDGKVFIINRKTIVAEKLDNTENIVQIAAYLTLYNNYIGYGLNLNGNIINLFDAKDKNEGGYKRIINYLDSFYGVTFDDKLIKVNVRAYKYF